MPSREVGPIHMLLKGAWLVQKLWSEFSDQHQGPGSVLLAKNKDLISYQN